MAQYFLDVADCCAPAWPFMMERRKGAMIDRRSSLIGGPLFTSVKHPWPTREGLYATPVIQIDLQSLSDLSGLPIGRGLLQVWAFSGNLLPRLETLVLEPVGLEDDLSEPPYLLDGFNYDAELESGDRARPRWIAEGCSEIIGFDQPFFAVPQDPFEYLLEEMTAIVAELGDTRIITKLRRLEALLPSCRSLWGSFAFGSFNRFTYTADERPPVLICLGSDLPFWFSDIGQLQVFFSFDADGEPSFSADWSIMT